MKELIFISFLLVVIIAFVVGYLTGKDAVKQKRRRTPHAPDGADSVRENGIYNVEWVDADTIRLTPRR